MTTLCSRLKPRPMSAPMSLNNRTCCPWECELVGTSALLLHDCSTSRHVASDQGCHSDFLEYLNKLLEIGIEVEWDLSEDAYFSSCRACRANHYVCGYNSSDPNKHFLCFHSQS